MGFEPTCPCGQLHFECSSLQPLRYASMYKYSLLGTNHMISSRSRYDLFDSPPYISTVFRALRKCKKNRQERYEILKFDPAKTLINQGFSAEKTARANAHFECCTFDHSDNSPCLFSSGFLSRNLLKNSLERKQERRQKIFDFEIFCVEEYQGESGGRNSQLLPKFRVRAVITTSIPLRMLRGTARIFLFYMTRRQLSRESRICPGSRCGTDIFPRNRGFSPCEESAPML